MRAASTKTNQLERQSGAGGSGEYHMHGGISPPQSMRLGCRVSLEDMMRYQVEWNEPASGQFQGYKITLSPTTFGAKNLASL